MEQNEMKQKLITKEKIIYIPWHYYCNSGSDSGTVTCGVKYCKGKCKRYF